MCTSGKMKQHEGKAMFLTKKETSASYQVERSLFPPPTHPSGRDNGLLVGTSTESLDSGGSVYIRVGGHL